MSEGKVFYKMTLGAYENGLSVHTQKFFSIHETPCFHYCVRMTDKGFMAKPLIRDDETMLQSAKRRGVRIFRVHKAGSRIAFESKEKAFDHLKMLKRRQIEHMQRTMEFNREFLKACKNTGPEVLEEEYANEFGEYHTVPGTTDLVRSHFIFD